MDCERFHELAFDYIEGSVDAGDAESVKAHLFSCSPCATTFRSIEENERILRRARVPAAPSGIDARIDSLIGRRPAPQKSGALGFVAAAAAILLIAGAFLVLAPSSGPELDVVTVKGEATEALGGLIPGYEEPQGGTRLAGTLLEPDGNK